MLAQEGADVVACDPFAHDTSWQYLAPYLLHDALSPGRLMEWLYKNRGRVTAIVHMGAISATTASDMSQVVENNIRLTLDLWHYVSEHDVPFIYASSAATYGNGEAGFVDDDSPESLASLRPLNLYGWSKHFVDRRIISDVTQGRPSPKRWAGLKFFNVFGPNEAHKGPMRSVVHQIYPAAARGDTVRLFKSARPDYSDGAQLRDFIYVKDCCEVIRRMLRAPRVAGIYNVGTGTARSFEDLALALFQAVGRPPSIAYIDMPEALANRYQYFTEANTTKLQAHGFAPAFPPLERSIADYVSSHLVREFNSDSS